MTDNIEELKRRNAKLSLLLEVNKNIISTLDLDKLLGIIMKFATRVVMAEASSLMLLDDSRENLVFDVVLGEETEKIKQIKVKIGEGIAGWVAEKGFTQVVNDVSKDVRWAKKVDDSTQFRTKSILCVPLKVKDTIIGVMEAINKVEDGEFSPEDVRFFESFASQAAIAIENAKLFKNLYKEKEKISAVFTGMSDGAVVTDEKMRIVMINGAACNLLNLDSEGIYGKSFNEVIAGYEISDSMDDCASEDENSCMYEISRKAGQSLYISNKTTKILDSESKEIVGCIMVLRDITEAKREEVAKRNFLSLMSHKLRTPLSVIIGYGDILAQKLEGSEKDIVINIANQGKTLAGLVDKLLSFTIIESEKLALNRKRVKIEDIVSKSIEKFNSMRRDESVTITVDDSIKSLPEILIDTEKVQEVIKNLIENGIKFNSSEQKQIRISGMNVDGNMIKIHVEDNGVGIPREEFERIFQKFYQIEESFTGQVEGAGLGLALAKRVVEIHGGSIWLESTLNNGSKFLFTLPLN